MSKNCAADDRESGLKAYGAFHSTWNPFGDEYQLWHTLRSLARIPWGTDRTSAITAAAAALGYTLPALSATVGPWQREESFWRQLAVSPPTPDGGTPNWARPFSDSSPWNTQISNQTWYDASTLHTAYAGNYWWVATSYGGIYKAQDSDPLWSVVMPDYKGAAWDRTRDATSFQVRAPAGMVVESGGSDLQLCVVHAVTGDELDVYHAALDSTNHIITHTSVDSGTATAVDGVSMTDGTKAWSTNQWNDSVNGWTVIVGTSAWARITSNTGTKLNHAGWKAIGSNNAAATPSLGAYTIIPPVGWGRTNVLTGTGWGLGDGNNPGTRAANASLSGGLLTQTDWDNGAIAHALAFASPAGEITGGGFPALTGFVAPATAGEPGGGGGTGSIKLGTRIGIPSWAWLQANLSGAQYTQAQADYSLLSSTSINGKLVGKMLWDCLQSYGAYLIDVTGGSRQFYADDKQMPTGNWDGVYAHWNNYFGTDKASMDVIGPYLRMQSPAA